MSIVLVSHSMEDILRSAERLILLANGRVVGAGAPCDIFRNTELLEQASLTPPHLLRLGKQIEEIGYPVGRCNTVREMADVILRTQR